MKRFEALDLYQLDSLLSEENIMIRQAIRNWVDGKVMLITEDAYQNTMSPIQLVPKMGLLGMLDANLLAEYGCEGINNVAYGLIVQELERGDSFASVQGGLV